MADEHEVPDGLPLPELLPLEDADDHDDILAGFGPFTVVRVAGGSVSSEPGRCPSTRPAVEGVCS